jgi:hypothetical protein
MLHRKVTTIVCHFFVTLPPSCCVATSFQFGLKKGPEKNFSSNPFRSWQCAGIDRHETSSFSSPRWRKIMRRRWLSEGVRNLNLSADLFAQMERQLWREDKKMGEGPGKLTYMPFIILVAPDGPPRLVGGDTSLSFGFGDMTLIGQDDKMVELVGILFKKRLKQANINAKPGDISFNLRSEWDEKENPLY